MERTNGLPRDAEEFAKAERRWDEAQVALSKLRELMGRASGEPI